MNRSLQKGQRVVILLALFCIIFVLFLGCSEPTPLYKPGSYTNQAEGYYSTLLVEIEVDPYQIRSITVLEHEEPKILSDVVFEQLPPRIIKANSTDIDVISGATYTSTALLHAVQKALDEAKESME